ncbi:MAG: ribosome assembly RNA-binding protein YhbY [Betaproteobacteria bacterium]|nr:ribosome assembly RNA-binding protein YhbY [Betaproteobacteria bacterium]
MISLSSAQRRYLRAAAHRLHPLVLVGEAGLTDAVLHEADRALESHELIKIRIAAATHEMRTRWLEAACERLSAAPVQHIGRTLVIYRPAKEPKLKLPGETKPIARKRPLR